MDEITAKNRSYRLHEALADHLGEPRYAHGYRCQEAVVLDDGRPAVLRSTANAGFNGIVGYFTGNDGQTFSTSLGHIEKWTVAS